MGEDVTTMLDAYGRGERGALDRLVPLVYDELRRVARGQLRRLRPGGTLDTTGLVHETYLKLFDQSRLSAKDRSHFLAIAARAMRQILVDHARRKGRAKRGGGAIDLELDEDQAAVRQQATSLLALSEALERLETIDARLVRVVECRAIAGYSETETAEILGISTRTARRDWMRAKAWLAEAMTTEPAG
jgi:RNA polymerase sigma factor (TIGR02999 family)